MTDVYTRERHENKNTRFWATYGQNAGNRDSELHKSKIFPGDYAPGPPLDRSKFSHSTLPKIFYPKIATSLIAKIVENNEDRNIIG